MVFAVLAIQLFGITEAQAATCGLNSDGEITDGSLSSGCTVTPDKAYFPIYKVGLCEEIPTYLNYQTACSIFIDNSIATEVEVSKNNNLSLKNGITLDVGTYKAAIVLLGNTIGLKHADTFESNRNGTESNGGLLQKSTGDYCSARLASGSEDDLGSGGLESFLDCADEVLVAGKFTETEGVYLTNGGDSCSINSSGAVVSSLSVASSSGETVNFCGMNGSSTLETYSNSTTTNATRQLAIQTFTTPVVTTENTKSIDIGFKLTDMLSLEERTVGSVVYTNAFIEGLSLTFTVQ